jgi:phage shock protein PspC (stress-responsive transcriptional regulator)
MQFSRNSLSRRSDTMFGVCEALGQDLGISANWFRIAFAAGVIFNLEYAVLAYVGVGALVLVSRLVYPSRAVVEAEATPVMIQDETPVAIKAPAKTPVLAEAA